MTHDAPAAVPEPPPIPAPAPPAPNVALEERKARALEESAIAAKEHARQAGFLADFYADIARTEQRAKTDEEIWWEAFLHRCPESAAPTSVAVAQSSAKLIGEFATAALALYRTKFPAV